MPQRTREAALAAMAEIRSRADDDERGSVSMPLPMHGPDRDDVERGHVVSLVDLHRQGRALHLPAPVDLRQLLACGGADSGRPR